jgi:hypothetical protein
MKNTLIYSALSVILLSYVALPQISVANQGSTPIISLKNGLDNASMFANNQKYQPLWITSLTKAPNRVLSAPNGILYAMIQNEAGFYRIDTAHPDKPSLVLPESLNDKQTSAMNTWESIIDVAGNIYIPYRNSISGAGVYQYGPATGYQVKTILHAEREVFNLKLQDSRLYAIVNNIGLVYSIDLKKLNSGMDPEDATLVINEARYIRDIIQSKDNKQVIISDGLNDISLRNTENGDLIRHLEPLIITGSLSRDKEGTVYSIINDDAIPIKTHHSLGQFYVSKYTPFDDKPVVAWAMDIEGGRMLYDGYKLTIGDENRVYLPLHDKFRALNSHDGHLLFEVPPPEFTKLLKKGESVTSELGSEFAVDHDTGWIYIEYLHHVNVDEKKSTKVKHSTRELVVGVMGISPDGKQRHQIMEKTFNSDELNDSGYVNRTPVTVRDGILYTGIDKVVYAYSLADVPPKIM